MNNTRISSLENYEQFKEVCSFFKLEEEYPGWTGTEKYGIITAVSETVLQTEYAVIMKALSPYIILDMNYAAVRNESINTERRYERKKDLHESLFSFDEETEYYHAELLCPDFSEEIVASDTLKYALSKLTEVQRRRVEQYFFHDMSLKEICESEGGDVTLVSVWQSIQAALKRMKKYF